MKIDYFKYKTIIIQKIAGLLGVRAHVYKSFSKEKTINMDDGQTPNDLKQSTSVPERQIWD